MRDKAYAKINLSLDIVGKREDGYHELNSIMIPINFYDLLTIDRSFKDEYICDKAIPFKEKNTIIKAITFMRNKYDIKDSFKVELKKCIPTQAGIGGGSADGASTIRILNKMYSLNMSNEEITEACLAVGADVPFTYFNKPAIVNGIGEKLDFFNIKNNRYVLLVKPRIGVSTKEAYSTLNLEKADHPNIEEIKRRLENGEEYLDLLGNSLEEPSLRLCPVIKEIKDSLKEKGFSYPMMSGSGSTVFVISDDLNKLEEVKEEFRMKRYFVFVTDFHI